MYSREFIAFLWVVTILLGVPGEQAARADEYTPAQHSVAHPDMAAFPSRPNTYKVIAGPRVASQVTHKSPFDHLPIEAKVPQSYAYGWFGGTPHYHWSRQFHSGKRHTQWSLK